MRRLAVFAVLVLLAGCRPLIPLGELLDSSPPPEEATLVQFSSAISSVTEADLAGSWRPGCPVAPEDLRLVSVTYWGFDDRPQQGELVVHAQSAEAIALVMEELYGLQFPIERMERVDAFEGDDDASMAANNTSAFNCREVSRRPGVWSQHAFGTAIDINPVQNPYILRNGTVLPPGSVTDRSTPATGLIEADSPVVAAFADIGWGWGGDWSGVLDYQHFSASGR
jgi:hypothetical protein